MVPQAVVSPAAKWHPAVHRIFFLHLIIGSLLSPQLPSHPLTPSRHAEGRSMTVAPTYHTLPHPSSHSTSLSSTMMWGPLEPPNTPKPWSLSCLRPAPPLRPSAALCYKEVSNTAWVCHLPATALNCDPLSGKLVDHMYIHMWSGCGSLNLTKSTFMHFSQLHSHVTVSSIVAEDV